ncbi:MAG: hypothetical protein JWL72_2791 [Ilumatobacteraceae bacterium]|nr:hypothetical protein [Ilumatobacteraceae bacterium]
MDEEIELSDSEIVEAHASDPLVSSSKRMIPIVKRYKGRMFGRNTPIALGFWMLIMLVVVLFTACNADQHDSQRFALPTTRPTSTVAPIAPSTVAPTTTGAPTTTAAATTTAAPTTMAAPTTTAAATTTIAAIAPEAVAAFTKASSYHDDSLRQIVPDLQVAGIKVYCDEAAQVDGQFIQDLNTTTTFGPAIQPLVDKLISALMANQQNEQNCARASSEAAANQLWNEQSTIDAGQAAIDAEAAVRTALGLPPLG